MSHQCHDVLGCSSLNCSGGTSLQARSCVPRHAPGGLLPQPSAASTHRSSSARPPSGWPAFTNSANMSLGCLHAPCPAAQAVTDQRVGLLQGVVLQLWTTCNAHASPLRAESVVAANHLPENARCRHNQPPAIPTHQAWSLVKSDATTRLWSLWCCGLQTGVCCKAGVLGVRGHTGISQQWLGHIHSEGLSK